jgi:D-xylonolactonase
MQCIADVAAVLGEGPCWVAREQALYWVDIEGAKLFRWAEGEDARTIELPFPLGSIASRARGGFVGAGRDGFYGIGEDYALTLIGDPEPDRPGNRFNDGKVDRQGRFWAGTMDAAEKQDSGALYRLDIDLGMVRIDDGYRVTNGPAFSLDGRTIYHTDSARQIVYAFELGKDGNVSHRRAHLQFGEGDGFPDGMTVDSEDCLWIAFWDGWCVRRFSPDGARIAEIAIPVARPTSVAFGGADLDTLFVTSASRGLSESERAGQPRCGGLFSVRPGVAGVAEAEFLG